MEITFYGGVREVTGSMHLLKVGQDRILLDCGMFQGRRKESNEKNQVMPVDPATLTNVVLSHAHIDHSGRLPILMKQGFQGPDFMYERNGGCLCLPVDGCRPHTGVGCILFELQDLAESSHPAERGNTWR